MTIFAGKNKIIFFTDFKLIQLRKTKFEIDSTQKYYYIMSNCTIDNGHEIHCSRRHRPPHAKNLLGIGTTCRALQCHASCNLSHIYSLNTCSTDSYKHGTVAAGPGLSNCLQCTSGLNFVMGTALASSHVIPNPSRSPRQVNRLESCYNS